MKDIIGTLLEELEEFSGNRLKRKNDLSTLIRLGYTHGQDEIIEDLSFTSKYVQGLFRVLNRASGINDVHNIDLIKTDLSNNIGKVKKQIEQLLTNADDPTKSYFTGNYLQLSQNCMFNLTELMSDLEWTKKYLNRIKRVKPG